MVFAIIEISFERLGFYHAAVLYPQVIFCLLKDIDSLGWHEPNITHVWSMSWLAAGGKMGA